MEQLVNAAQAKRIDESIQSTYGISSMLLMERAALSMYGFLEDRGFLASGRSFGILCGPGNNGGDGLALARLLLMHEEKVVIYLACDKKSFTDSALRQYTMVKKLNAFFAAFADELAECDCLIDALFGVGLSRAITGEYADLVDRVNAFSSFKIACDMPSGIDASTGAVLGKAIRCDATITFGYRKYGQLLYPGRSYCGDLRCDNIGLNMALLASEKAECYAIEEKEIADLAVRRTDDSHKGTFGKVLVVAGSKGMSGAAYLCASAALTAGCGMVEIYTDECNRTILSTLLPEAILITYEGSPDPASLRKCIDWADVIALGPGIGRSQDSRVLFDTIVAYSKLPLILDADGLNLLAEDPDCINRYDGPVVLTPHMAEMSRLCGCAIDDLKRDRIAISREFCQAHQVTVVLKDACTVTVSPYKPTWINTSGNSGLSTAGSGDVLCGMIAGLTASTDPTMAVPMAVYLHGKCADLYAATHNKASMKASDIIDAMSTCY